MTNEQAKPTDSEIQEMLKQAEQEAGVAAVLEAYDQAEAIYWAIARHIPEPHGYSSNTTVADQPTSIR